ncbi:MAG: hypothetical protein AB1564_03045 [Chloroflexota bacterium]
MSFPQILEVAIGLIVVYYILGSFVSLITKLINEAAETRGKSLEKHLFRIAGDKTADLKNLPQIQALRPVRYKHLWSIFGSVTEQKMVEKIPAATLVDAFFDISGLTGRPGVDANGLLDTINQLPESEGKQAMLNWIKQGVTDINDLRSRAHAYFSGVLNQAAATFKANARSLVIILSILITILFGTDSIQLAQGLWNNAELRAIAAAQANAIVQAEGAQADLSQLIEDLSALTIKIGWWQAQNIPQQPSAMAWVQFFLLKFIGLGVTAAAVSQGSSFWYDLLKKLTTPASSSGSSEGGEAKG